MTKFVVGIPQDVLSEAIGKFFESQKRDFATDTAMVLTPAEGVEIERTARAICREKEIVVISEVAWQKIAWKCAIRGMELSWNRMFPNMPTEGREIRKAKFGADLTSGN